MKDRLNDKKLPIIGMVGLVIVVLIGLVIHSNQPTHYSYYDQPVSKVLSQITDNAKKNKDTLLVLHKTGCNKCEEAESEVTKQMHEAQKRDRTTIVSIDTASLTKSEVDKIVELLPELKEGDDVQTSEVVTVGNQLGIPFVMDKFDIMDHSDVRMAFQTVKEDNK